ncbi:MAG TPA: CDP-diacylglycerol--serine O-phosphatidyltransferase, partial [Stenotrophomonas sp.]
MFRCSRYPVAVHAPRVPMKRHFSMLREFQLADWFTLGNAFC